jgi:hypothetical protein
MTARLEGPLPEGVIERIIRPDYAAFEAQLRSSGYCERPVRLQGHVDVCDGYGQRQHAWTTDGEPDGLLRKACGNRREAICAPCAERYRGDAWQLVAAGLRGGKAIPESVAGHRAVFATLTAPSFGVVHAHVLGPDGQPLRCVIRAASNPSASTASCCRAVVCMAPTTRVWGSRYARRASTTRGR